MSSTDGSGGYGFSLLEILNTLVTPRSESSAAVAAGLPGLYPGTESRVVRRRTGVSSDSLMLPA